MELNTLIEIFYSLANGENLRLLCGAIFCCVFTSIVKKLLPKTKIDLLRKFDPTVVMPFALAMIFCGICSFFQQFASIGEQMAWICTEALCTGALSTVIYHLYSSLDGGSLKQLLKDDNFSLIYNQLLAFTDAKKRLIEGTLTQKNFVGEIQTLVANVSVIYEDNLSDQQKRQKLIALLGGIIDSDTIDKVIDTIHLGLLRNFD